MTGRDELTSTRNRASPAPSETSAKRPMLASWENRIRERRFSHSGPRDVRAKIDTLQTSRFQKACPIDIDYGSPTAARSGCSCSASARGVYRILFVYRAWRRSRTHRACSLGTTKPPRRDGVSMISTCSAPRLASGPATPPRSSHTASQRNDEFPRETSTKR